MLGTPRAIYSATAVPDLPTCRRDITIVHPVRPLRPGTIHTNGTLHPRGPIGFRPGDSRARWEGDTLVVDVAHFNREDLAGPFRELSQRSDFDVD